MKIPAVLLSVCCLVSTASARIGETPAECAARYGEPVSFDADTQTQYFEKAGLLIAATFHEGKCEAIDFQKAEEDALGKPVPLSDNEIERLLEANADGSVWDDPFPTPEGPKWSTKDGRLAAYYARLDRNLLVATLAYLKRSAADRKRKEQEKLDGF